MKFFFSIGFFILCCPIFSMSQALSVKHLKVDNKKEPLGVESLSPHLSWQLLSERRAVLQKAYQVLVADDSSLLARGTGNVWNSGKVNSDSSIQVAYKGKRLDASKKYYWRVKVWDNYHDSAWSDISNWQMGMIFDKDWKGAQWIGFKKFTEDNLLFPESDKKVKGQWNDTLPLFRKTFSISKPIKQATAFISGLGQFELFLNGKKVGDHFLDPGWTNYQKNALYVTFDVTDRLKSGRNAIGVMLGNGFYYIPVWQHRYRKLTVKYGYPKLICLVKVTYEDGSVSYITSDKSWKTAAGPIVFSSIYGGEDYNANLEKNGWKKPNYSDEDWRDAVEVEGPDKLLSQMDNPVKIFEHFYPENKYKDQNGYWVFDLGQNASGIPEIWVRGHQGDTVKIIPGEIVHSNGDVSQKSSGGPSYYTYILKGEGIEKWHPQFTYYGFRYLQIKGAVVAGEANPESLPVIEKVRGLHIRNAAPSSGYFRCSSRLFNRIYRLIDWAIRSNMVSIFTDCPTREKLGWLEEVNLMGKAIHYNYNIAGLLNRTIQNMKDAQTESGFVPNIAPAYAVFGGDFQDSPEWGSSSVIVPWLMYKLYGDKNALKESYKMMKEYVDYLKGKASDNILSFGLSDWYDIGAKRSGFSQLTPDGVTATATYYYDLHILEKTAGILNRPKEAEKFNKQAEKVKKSFSQKFFHEESKEYATGSQTANAMAIYMGLVPRKYKEEVFKNIITDIYRHDTSFTTGEIGYPYLLRILDKAGKADLIYKMNNRTDVSGYGYQLKHGATALTESWRALNVASNNHLMLGHLMEWLYTGIGGIDQSDQSIAYHDIVIAPHPVGDITSANVGFQSPYGEITSRWMKKDSSFEIFVKIPANTRATINLPLEKEQLKVLESGREIKDRKHITLIDRNEKKARLKVGSGKYHFVVKEIKK